MVFNLIPIFFLFWVGYQSFVVNGLPSLSGELVINGIRENVIIRRDTNGVAHIRAKNDIDVYLAMGFAHAQDRLWQLEIQRRLSQGRLSEIFGRSSVDQDIWIRTLGIHQAAKNSLSHLSKQAIASLDAYSAGVNAWLDSVPQLPIEFSLLGVKPEPWTKEDSLSWIKMFALNLNYSYINEIQRFIGLQYLAKDQLQVFFPDFQNKVSLEEHKKKDQKFNYLYNLYNLHNELEQDNIIGGRNVGSNAWVISGKLTDSGAPILANDPHMALQIPSFWYVVSQKGDKLNSSGMSLVGTPLVIFGKNKNIAWGGTNMMADVQDLYFETLNPNEPTKYKTLGQWKEFETFTEVFEVKAAFPSMLRKPLVNLKIQVRRSVHGPIISDVVKGFDQPVAMRWTALDEDDTSYESFYRLNYANDWSSFKKALSLHVAPTLNILYADIRNNIGFVGAGKIPIRNKGKGLLPVPGADSSYYWSGYIPNTEMPQSYNPPKGYLINANNKNTSDKYPYYISQDFSSPVRAMRIEQIIKSNLYKNKKLSIMEMKKIQGDVNDLSVTNLLVQFNKMKCSSSQQCAILKILREWSGEASEESVGATLYYGLLRHLKRNLFSDELQGYWNQKVQSGYLESMQSILSADTVNIIIEKNSKWCDNITSVEVEDCSSILEQSFEDMEKELTKMLGTNIQRWNLGKIQHTIYTHVPFSKMNILDNIFERRISNGGSANTVNVSNGSFTEEEGSMQSFGSSFRQIIQLGTKQSEHLFMGSTGQSGQIASPNYDNMIEQFRDVKYFNLLESMNWSNSTEQLNK